MSRCKVDPLRPLTEEERQWLEKISRSQAEPAAHVARASALLAVAEGLSYTDAAHAAGRKSGDTVSRRRGLEEQRQERTCQQVVRKVVHCEVHFVPISADLAPLRPACGAGPRAHGRAAEGHDTGEGAISLAADE
jgi:hypothetical protein